MHWIDPDSLSPVTSKVSRFLFNPKGEADGLLTVEGTEVHFPPHLSKQVLRLIRPGDSVTLYGIKPRGAEMISCVALENARGDRIEDRGPPPKAKKKKQSAQDPDREAGLTEVESEDIIERTLHGPKGEVRGLLLSSGRIARFPPHAGEAAGSLLEPGESIAVRGQVRTVGGTEVIEVSAWGKSRSRLKSLQR